jgi:hypothetical protein
MTMPMLILEKVMAIREAVPISAMVLGVMV